MLTFYTKDGKCIPFDSKNELTLEKNTDVTSKKTSSYLIIFNEIKFEVSKETYEAVERL